MSSRRRNLNYWLGAWFPVIAGVCVIVIESTGSFGADHTTGPLRWIYESIFGPVSNVRWDNIHHYLRKTGHFTGYGLLGLAWLRAWWMTLPRSEFLLATSLALLGTAITAGSDELHQTFLPNRTGSPWDVLLDCGGALTMQLVVYLFMRMFRPKRLAREA
jgi:VanZ family protein